MNITIPDQFGKQLQEFVIAHNLTMEEFAVSAFERAIYGDENTLPYHLRKTNKHHQENVTNSNDK